MANLNRVLGAETLVGVRAESILSIFIQKGDQMLRI